ncbi:MAG: CopG family transcriptional regulator [Anaerosomatales bacterium]|nr:ribbon-helix-helix domain-containing protein [Anaerosomatales bacterium]MDT8434245.1 CopG family transcriptional regulator [Anaerosomatales bacterium]
MTAKVTISLPDDLFERLDAEAGELGVSRSELVQESLSAYLGKTQEQRADEARRVRMLEALEGMRTFHIGREIRDDRPTLEILREVRETDDSAPMRDIRKDRR